MKNAKKAIVLLLVSMLLLLAVGSSGAYFSDMYELSGMSISTGAWIIPPEVCSCCPCVALLGIWTHVSIHGQGFQENATVELVQGASVIAGTYVRIISPNELSCSFCLWGASCGTYDIRVTNPDGGTATLSCGFTVVLSLGGILEGVGDIVSGAAGAPNQVSEPQTTWGPDSVPIPPSAQTISSVQMQPKPSAKEDTPEASNDPSELEEPSTGAPTPIDAGEEGGADNTEISSEPGDLSKAGGDVPED